jgi:hypothetical protein
MYPRIGRSLIPKLKMATPFLVLKTLTGFDFQFTKVSSHFCELVLLHDRSKQRPEVIAEALQLLEKRNHYDRWVK